MNSGRGLAALAGFWLALAAAFADSPFVIQSWHRTDGLPQNTVQAIAQTADGYLGPRKGQL